MGENKGRETVTLSKRMYIIGSTLNESDRSRYYHSVLGNLFEGKEISLECVSEALKIAFVCIMPELRKLQIKYENGKRYKSALGTDILLCEKEKSETQANDKQKNLARASNYNIYSANYIYSNKQTNEQTSAFCENDAINITEYENMKNKINFYTEILEEKADEIKSIDTGLHARFMNLVHKISKEEGKFYIQGETLGAVAVLERYLALFSQDIDSITTMLSAIFTEVDYKAENKTFNITNKYRYMVSAVYNIASGL